MAEAVLGATMVGEAAEVEPVEEMTISKTTHTITIITIISNTAGIRTTEIIVTSILTIDSKTINIINTAPAAILRTNSRSVVQVVDSKIRDRKLHRTKIITEAVTTNSSSIHRHIKTFINSRILVITSIIRTATLIRTEDMVAAKTIIIARVSISLISSSTIVVGLVAQVTTSSSSIRTYNLNYRRQDLSNIHLATLTSKEAVAVSSSITRRRQVHSLTKEAATISSSSISLAVAINSTITRINTREEAECNRLISHTTHKGNTEDNKWANQSTAAITRILAITITINNKTIMATRVITIITTAAAVTITAVAVVAATNNTDNSEHRVINVEESTEKSC